MKKKLFFLFFLTFCIHNTIWTVETEKKQSTLSSWLHYSKETALIYLKTQFINALSTGVHELGHYVLAKALLNCSPTISITPSWNPLGFPGHTTINDKTAVTPERVSSTNFKYSYGLILLAGPLFGAFLTSATLYGLLKSDIALAEFKRNNYQLIPALKYAWQQPIFSTKNPEILHSDISFSSFMAAGMGIATVHSEIKNLEPLIRGADSTSDGYKIQVIFGKNHVFTKIAVNYIPKMVTLAFLAGAAKIVATTFTGLKQRRAKFNNILAVNSKFSHAEKLPQPCLGSCLGCSIAKSKKLLQYSN